MAAREGDQVLVGFLDGGDPCAKVRDGPVLEADHLSHEVEGNPNKVKKRCRKSSPALSGEGDRAQRGGGASFAKRPLHHASHGPPPPEIRGRRGTPRARRAFRPRAPPARVPRPWT